MAHIKLTYCLVYYVLAVSVSKRVVVCLNFYCEREQGVVFLVCVFLPESVTITPKDARWVGAWWLGFFVSSIILLLASIPFWFLPRSLPKQGEENKLPSDTPEGVENGTNHNNMKMADIAKGKLTGGVSRYEMLLKLIEKDTKHQEATVILVLLFFHRLPALPEEAAGNSSLLPVVVRQHPEVQLLHRPAHLQGQVHGAAVRTVGIQSQLPHRPVTAPHCSLLHKKNMLTIPA